MTVSFADACAAIAAAVPAADRGAAIVSIDPTLYAAGENVGVDRILRPAEAPLWLGFIDLEPERNWGHRALTVIVRDNGDTEVHESQFPPLLPDGRRLQPIE